MQIGDTYEYKNVVTKEITAGALGSGGLDIFATPFLICWMEAAAYYYMKEQLPEGKRIPMIRNTKPITGKSPHNFSPCIVPVIFPTYFPCSFFS